MVTGKEITEMWTCLGIIGFLYLVLYVVIRLKQVGDEVEREFGKEAEK